MLWVGKMKVDGALSGIASVVAQSLATTQAPAQAPTNPPPATPQTPAPGQTTPAVVVTLSAQALALSRDEQSRNAYASPSARQSEVNRPVVPIASGQQPITYDKTGQLAFGDTPGSVEQSERQRQNKRKSQTVNERELKRTVVEHRSVQTNTALTGQQKHNRQQLIHNEISALEQAIILDTPKPSTPAPSEEFYP